MVKIRRSVVILYSAVRGSFIGVGILGKGVVEIFGERVRVGIFGEFKEE